MSLLSQTISKQTKTAKVGGENLGRTCLEERFGRGRNWVKKVLDKSEVRKSLDIFPQKIICIFDTTHIGESLLLTAREPNLKANLAWAWIESETKEAYAELKQNIELRGFVLLGVVL